MPKAAHRPAIFYGWLVVIIAFFIAFVMAGSGSAFGVFVIPMSREFHWNRSIISLAFFFSTLAWASAAAFSVNEKKYSIRYQTSPLSVQT